MPEGTYTPWYRRWFTNETERELRETYELYDRVARSAKASGISLDGTLNRLVRVLGKQLPDGFTLFQPFTNLLYSLAAGERYMFELPARSLRGLTLRELVEHRKFLHQKVRYLENRARYEDLFDDCIVSLLSDLAGVLPTTKTPSPFTIPLFNAVPNPREIVQHIYAAFCRPEFLERGMFDPIAEQMSRNLAAASGLNYSDPSPKKPPVFPIDSTLPLPEFRRAYIGRTVFDELFDSPVPLKLTHEDRFSHMHIVGGTGAGKTTLLENLILHDLKSDDPPALVIVDSQGDLIRKVSRLAALSNRDVVLISPKDVEYPPALNVFDVNRERLNGYDQASREQVIAGVIQTFDYLFSGLLGADMTAKQSLPFRYITRLMLSLPDAGVFEDGVLVKRNATILDMLRLIDDTAPYQAAIDAMAPIQRDWFMRDFKAPTFKLTRDQIKYRLHLLIENPTFARLFTSPETRIDLFTELNRGSIILVDTAKDFLKGSSAHFGQIFISLVLQAILERATLPESDRRHTFLIVDEAAEYFDSNIDDLLTESRKQKLGCVFAHQYLDQCTQALRASLAANTSIKFAAGISTGDARSLAPELRTTADFILNQPRLHFAAHIRNVTPQAVSIPAEVGRFEAEPQLSASEYQEFIERNRERVSYRAQSHVPVSPSPPNEMSDEY